MNQRALQPNNRAPITKDVVEIVKKKVGAPLGPPPSNMTSFTAPKSYRFSSREIEYSKDEDEEDEDDDLNHDDEDDQDRYYTPRSHRLGRKGYHEDELAEESYHETRRTASTSSASKSTPQRSRIIYDEDNDVDEVDEEDYHRPKSSHTDYSRSSSRRGSEHEVIRSSDSKYDPKRSSSNRGMYSDEKPSSVNRSHARGSSLRFSDLTAKSTSLSPHSRQRIFSFRPLLKATYRDLRNFSWSPCEEGLLVRCFIERDRTGTFIYKRRPNIIASTIITLPVTGSNAFSPFYSLCADMDDGTGREIMVCRKVTSTILVHSRRFSQQRLYL